MSLRRKFLPLALAAASVALSVPSASATTTGVPYVEVNCRAPYTDSHGVTDTPCIGFNTNYNIQGEADVTTNGHAVTACKAQLVHVVGNIVEGTVTSTYVSGGHCTAQGQWANMPNANDEYVIRGFYQMGGVWYGQPESPAFYWAS
jgi:hypothetical protein